MKRFRVSTLATLLVLATMAPSAHAIGVMASWWNIDKTDDDGFGGGLRSKAQIVPLVSFDTRVSWINFSDSNTNVFPIEATGMLKLGMLYAGLGVGYYIFDAEDVDVDNNFGWYLVGGIDIGAGPVGVFGEVKWTMLSADIEGVNPSLSTELDADGIGFNAGVMFGVPGM
jgi:hypothetical protein